MVHWSLPVTCIKVSPCCTETQSFVEHPTHSCVPRVQGRKSSALREVALGRFGQEMLWCPVQQQLCWPIKWAQVWYSQLISAEGWPTGQEMKTLCHLISMLSFRADGYVGLGVFWKTYCSNCSYPSKVCVGLCRFM